MTAGETGKHRLFCHNCCHQDKQATSIGQEARSVYHSLALQPACLTLGASRCEEGHRAWKQMS